MTNANFFKLNSWGSKKEYPTIISILVAIFLPIVGLIFVHNQTIIKEMAHGRISGLFAIALISSILWWGLLVLLLFVLFNMF